MMQASHSTPTPQSAARPTASNHKVAFSHGQNIGVEADGRCARQTHTVRNLYRATQPAHGDHANLAHREQSLERHARKVKL